MFLGLSFEGCACVGALLVVVFAIMMLLGTIVWVISLLVEAVS